MENKDLNGFNWNDFNLLDEEVESVDDGTATVEEIITEKRNEAPTSNANIEQPTSTNELSSKELPNNRAEQEFKHGLLELEKMKLEIELNQERERRKIDEEKAELRLKQLQIERDRQVEEKSQTVQVDNQIELERQRQEFERERFQHEIKMKELELDFLKQSNESTTHKVETPANASTSVEPKIDIIQSDNAYHVKNNEEEVVLPKRRYEIVNDVSEKMFTSRRTSLEFALNQA